MIQPYSLELEANNDLIKSLQRVALSEKKSGYILSVVGNLTTAKIQCPGKTEPTVINGHLEIIALNGTISPEKCHLHICFSDGDCNVWAGHLEEGTKILKSLDILIGFLGTTFTKTSPKEKTNEIEVDIYILPNCTWSSRAVRMLRTLQISHDIKIIKDDIEFKALNKKTNHTTFPQIFINGEFIGGYSELAELHSSGKLSNFKE